MSAASPSDPTTPPLSKDHLAGEIADEEVSFRPADWYEDNRVELVVDRRATGLDPKRRRLELDDGAECFYEQLVIATGAAARRLPPLEDFSNVHYLRTLADARRLREELREGARLAVVGAGFIGQEVASTARAAGAEVTIVEALPAPLTGILGEEVGLWLMKMHDEEGVEVRLSTKLEGARGNGSVEELVLDRGDPIACDAVVVGIGVAPAANWLRGSGLETDGVLTDNAGRTSVPDVWAAGDVARAFDHRHGEHRRSEHWDAAARQGMAVARAIAGDQPDPARCPASGATSTACGSSTSAMPRPPMRLGSRVSRANATSPWSNARGAARGALVVGRPKAFALLRKEIERTYSQQMNGKEKQ